MFSTLAGTLAGVLGGPDDADVDADVDHEDEDDHEDEGEGEGEGNLPHEEPPKPGQFGGFTRVLGTRASKEAALAALAQTDFSLLAAQSPARAAAKVFPCPTCEQDRSFYEALEESFASGWLKPGEAVDLAHWAELACPYCSEALVTWAHDECCEDDYANHYLGFGSGRVAGENWFGRPPLQGLRCKGCGRTEAETRAQDDVHRGKAIRYRAGLAAVRATSPTLTARRAYLEWIGEHWHGWVAGVARIEMRRHGVDHHRYKATLEEHLLERCADVTFKNPGYCDNPHCREYDLSDESELEECIRGITLADVEKNDAEELRIALDAPEYYYMLEKERIHDLNKAEHPAADEDDEMSCASFYFDDNRLRQAPPGIAPKDAVPELAWRQRCGPYVPATVGPFVHTDYLRESWDDCIGGWPVHPCPFTVWSPGQHHGTQAATQRRVEAVLRTQRRLGDAAAIRGATRHPLWLPPEVWINFVFPLVGGLKDGWLDYAGARVFGHQCAMAKNRVKKPPRDYVPTAFRDDPAEWFGSDLFQNMHGPPAPGLELMYELLRQHEPEAFAALGLEDRV